MLEQGLVLLLVLEVFLGQRDFLGLYFLLELVDLMIDDLIASLGLGYLILSLR